ncbi:FCRL6 isoform 6 [Pongo abelii]|uniref:FCRL6 isoform 6 n=1 Tax=Pongo abelii TaxID=9601 RepID=A0A2J8VHE5_PONAB|nr:FCRL6 isoform 6 [Pongo abelii]
MLLWTAVLLFVPCVGKTVWLYLQAWPNPVFEGDALTLRCQGLKNTPLSQVKFYRDGKFLHFSKENQTLSMGAATVQSRGQYSCSGQVMYIPQSFTQTSETAMVQVQAPVSRPVLTLHHGPADPAVGDMVQLLCEAQRGSPPILYSFYLDEKIVGNHSAPSGGTTSLLFPVKSEQDAGNYSCEAENNVSRERSEPKKLSLKGSQVLSTPTSSNWLVPWLPVSLLGLMVIAATLLVYLRSWRKAGPLPSQIPPTAPGGEQCPLYANVHHQKGKDEGVVYSVVHRTSKRSEARPAEFTGGRKFYHLCRGEMPAAQ